MAAANLFTATTGRPQDISESLSGENLAEELRQENSPQQQPYNLKVGPVNLRAEADLNISAQDNIGLSKDNRVADILITPSATLRGAWQISDLNTLQFDLGIGYQTYLLHSQYDSITLSPDSSVSFNFFVGPVAIKLHDSFSYQQDPTQFGQISNQVRLINYTNDAGVGLKWDLSSFILSLDYDHSNFWVTNSIYDYLTNQSDTISPKIAFPISKQLEVGVQSSVSSVRYQQSFQNGYVAESIEPYVSDQLTSYLSVDAQGGGYFSQYGNTGGNQDSSNIVSFVANFGINHQINSALSESLTGGREFLPGITSNYTDRIYANYADNCQATQTINVGLSTFWENLTDSNAAQRETSDRFGLGLNVADTLSDHLTLNLGYQFTLKDANPSILSYVLNVGSIDVQYNF